jgi:3-deoxy-D-arabino-heptulosonate 7-phosphate (DAHP) synthase
VILCERGIRTFETATRNTFDISAIPVIKKLSHLPSWRTRATAPGGATWWRRWRERRWPPAPTV